VGLASARIQQENLFVARALVGSFHPGLPRRLPCDGTPATLPRFILSTFSAGAWPTAPGSRLGDGGLAKNSAGDQFKGRILAVILRKSLALPRPAKMMTLVLLA
jgi:hypothetical protein